MSGFYQMDWDEFQSTREFIERKALQLMEHESKSSAAVGFPMKNYNVYQKGGRTFYYVGTNIFKGIFERNLLLATQSYPAKFGTRHALDVIEAINNVVPLYPDIQNTARLLRSDHYGILFENKDGKMEDKALRLDLYRQLDPTPYGTLDFTGGVLHALRHFSYNGTPLSTSKQIHDIPSTNYILELILEAFYLNPGYFKNPTTYISIYNYNDRFDLKFVFYYETTTRVYFLKTIHQVEKKKDTATSIF